MDGPRYGCATAGNPVELSANRAKVDFQTDLVVAGDYPIEWARSFMGRPARVHGVELVDTWNFLEVKSGSVSYNASTGASLARFSRGDGSFLTFQGTGTPGSRTWSSLQTEGYERPITSTLVDWTANGDPDAVVLTTHSGIQEHYDGGGKLVLTRNRQGRTHTYSYDTSGLLSRIEQDNGRYLSVSYADTAFTNSGAVSIEIYNPNPLDPPAYDVQDVMWIPRADSASDLYSYPVVASVTDGERTVSYTWEQTFDQDPAMPRLVAVSDANGKSIALHYGEVSANMGWTGWTDADGKRMGSYVYDWNGEHLEKEWKGAPPTETVSTNKIDYLSITDGGVYDGLGNVFGYSSSPYSFRVDSYNKPCRWCSGDSFLTASYRTDGRYDYLIGFNNQKTSYTYDSLGNVASVKEAATNALARTTSYTWATGMRVPLTRTEPVQPGGVAGTRTTTWAYTSDWQVDTMAVEAPVGAGTQTRTWDFGYDTNGRLASLTRPDGTQDAFLHNDYGDLIAREANPGTTGAQMTRWGGHLADGLPRWSIDPHGVVAAYTWDNEGRLLEALQWAGSSLPADDDLGATSWAPTAPGSGVRATAYQYSDAGRLERVDYPDGTYTTFDYDVAGRLYQWKDYDLNDSLVSSIVLTLNVMSDITQVEVRDASGTAVRRSGAVLDEQGRLRQALNAAQQALYTQDYNTQHQPTTQEDILGRDESRQYDALGRLTTFLDANSQTHLLTYGPQDEVLTATDGRGVVTSYTYNGFGDVVSLASPDRGTWAFGYDAAGRRTTTTDPRGVVATTAFDALSRPSSVAYSDDAVSGSAAGFVAGDITHAFGYDSCTHGAGRLCSLTDPTGTTAYSYNAWGEVVGQAWTGASGTPGAGITLSTGYAYDATTGRLTTVTLPSGKVLAVGYGSEGQISSLAYDGQGVVANVDWTAFGAIAGWTWPMATGWSGTHASVAFGYDLDARPVAISDLDERDLAWDAGNRLLGVDDPNDAARAQAYGYDALDRLTDADVGAWSEALAYGYDAVGNRTGLRGATSQDGMDYSYGTSHNRLVARAPVAAGTPGTAVAMAYDAMGNLIDDGLGLTLGFDATGRLVEASKGVSVVRSGYSAQGQRVTRQVVGGSTAGITLFAYDTQGRPLGAYVPDSSQSNGFRVLEEYVHLDGWRVVAVVRPDATTGMANPRFFPVLSDHLGTPRKGLDGQTGETRWAWDAKEPFGFELPNEVPTSGLAAFSFDLRFPGQRDDPETGLFQNGFRDYHPGLGRYVESDPLGLGAGWNTYAYGLSNSLVSFDPTGLDVIYKGYSESAKNSVRSVASDLTRSPTFRLMIGRLEMSPATYEIYATQPGVGSYFGYVDRNGVRVPQIAIDLSSTPVYQCGDSFNFLDTRAALAHEIGHAYDSDMSRFGGGLFGFGLWSIPGTSESRNTYREGVIMREIGERATRGRPGVIGILRSPYDYWNTYPYFNGGKK